MTKLITDDRTAERIKTARAALKGVNVHVADVLKHSEDMANIMEQVSAQLRRISEKSGEVYIPVWSPEKRSDEPTSLKSVLQKLSSQLSNGAAK